jgi:hypothetical protein
MREKKEEVRQKKEEEEGEREGEEGQEARGGRKVVKMREQIQVSVFNLAEKYRLLGTKSSL